MECFKVLVDAAVHCTMSEHSYHGAIVEWNGMEWNVLNVLVDAAVHCTMSEHSYHGAIVEWNGMEWNGMEWNGMEWNGMEWNVLNILGDAAVAQCCTALHTVYPVCGMVRIKEPLLLIGKSSPCGGSWFPLSLSEWSFTICLTPCNRCSSVLYSSLHCVL